MDGNVGRWSTTPPNGSGQYVWFGGVARSNHSINLDVNFVAKRS